MDTLYQGKISPVLDDNQKLEFDERMANLEHDTVMNYQLLSRSLDKSRKYEDYLDKLMRKEEDAAEFWRSAKLRIVSSTIWSGIIIIAGACWFAFKEALNRQ